MIIFILACSGNTKISADDTQSPIDTYEERTDTADPSDTSSITEVSRTYQLSVEHGYGSGDYEEGAIVHVFADFIPGNEVVTDWSGDLVLSPEWHQQFMMPATDIAIKAHIDATDFALTEVQYEGTQDPIRILYAVPENPIGVLFLFHGTGGSADVAFSTPFQNISATAYRQGLAIVVTEAHERTMNDGGADQQIRWNVAPNPNTNIDIQNIQSISQDISTFTQVPSDGLRLGLGISNGGAFAITVGAILSFDAVTSLCGVGRESVFSQTQTPTQWLMCDNDTNETVSSKRDQWENGTNTLQERGIRTDYGVFPAAPLYPERFMRIGATRAESESAIEELRVNEALDGGNFLQITPNSIGLSIVNQPDNWPVFLSLIEQYGPDKVKTELKQTYADHGAFDDWTHRMIAFWRG